MKFYFPDLEIKGFNISSYLRIDICEQCICICIGFVFLCTPTTFSCKLTSLRVLPQVACEAGYSACLQPASESTLKLYTCAEKRSRHFSTVCLHHCFLWCYALFGTSSGGDLFPGPWLCFAFSTITCNPTPVRLLVAASSERNVIKSRVNAVKWGYGKRLSGIRLWCW